VQGNGGRGAALPLFGAAFDYAKSLRVCYTGSMSERGRLGDWLTAYLEAQKFTSGLVGSRGKINPTTVQRLANGTIKDPSLDTLKALAKGLGIPLEAVLEGMGAIPPRGGANMPGRLRLFVQIMLALSPQELNLVTPPLQTVLESLIAAVRQGQVPPATLAGPKTGSGQPG
jgi:transcriptional regulator with XRE-family HTH domain